MDESESTLAEAINQSAQRVFDLYGPKLGQMMLGRMKSAMINAANSVGDAVEGFEWEDSDHDMPEGMTSQECLVKVAGKQVSTYLSGKEA